FGGQTQPGGPGTQEFAAIHSFLFSRLRVWFRLAPKSSQWHTVVGSQCRPGRAARKAAVGVSTFSTRVCALMPSSSRRASLVRARFEAPLGALENSPGRKPCGTGPETRQPR